MTPASVILLLLGLFCLWGDFSPVLWKIVFNFESFGKQKIFQMWKILFFDAGFHKNISLVQAWIAPVFAFQTTQCFENKGILILRAILQLRLSGGYHRQLAD